MRIFRNRNSMAALLRFVSLSLLRASILKRDPPHPPQLREGRLFRHLIPAKPQPPSPAASTSIPLPQRLLPSRIPRPAIPWSITNAGATPTSSTDATPLTGTSSVHPASGGRILALVPRPPQDGILSRRAHAPPRALVPYERKSVRFALHLIGTDRPPRTPEAVAPDIPFLMPALSKLRRSSLQSHP